MQELEHTILIYDELSFCKERNYKKNEFIFHTGDKVTQIGMVLEGTVHMMKEDVWGNVMILGEACPGDLFGEVYSCAGVKHLEVGVVAKTDVKVLFLDIQKVLTVCSNGCEFHSKIIRNLLSSIAERTLEMTRKVEHMSQRSLRDKYCLIYHQKLCVLEVRNLQYHLIDSNWQSICQ